MKIVTWNCNGAFRKKFKSIIDLDADIYVIQECEDPKLCKDEDYKNWARNYLWIGDSKNKGLAIFAKENIKIEKLDWVNVYDGHEVKHFLPCLINNKTKLLAIWAHQNNSPTFGYIGQIWKYLKINKDKLRETIIIGDFNSNSIWDKWDRWWNHSDVVNELNEVGLNSVYHYRFNEKQGEETKPTFFLQRKVNKPYHIDYIFSNEEVLNTLRYFDILEKENWLDLSDHLPLLLEY